MPRLAFPPSALRVLTLRSFVLWALVHALTFVALAMMQGADSVGEAAMNPARPNPLWVTAVSTMLLMVDVRRRGERAMWGNLGVSTTQLATLAAMVCVAGEALLAVVLP
ncbi:MAG TPA: hypothetical protein VJT85_11720 [Gemmatimonadaceae bacterium]|nr:hypothetical protein [Gemmatimonadaceae bacterium]